MFRSDFVPPLAAAWLAMVACVCPSRADVLGAGDRAMLQYGPYVAHRIDNEAHNQWPHLIGMEYESAPRWLAGAAAFENSYYQRAAYVYAGKRWYFDPVAQNLYVKITAGLVYGYKEPFEDRLPVNNEGYGLGIVPALGYQFGRANAQIVFLGTAAVVVTFGYDVLN